MSNVRPYQLASRPLLGAEVHGIDLTGNVSSSVIEMIKKDVTDHRIVIFRNQNPISGHRQVEISQWFGQLESTFYKHPKSPHPDVFRVSNVESEGCVGVGRTGWHIDGSFQSEPFSHSLYYMHHVPKHGDTAFIPLNDVLKKISEVKRQRWERLWMCSDRRGYHSHPLVYPHPITGLKTLCFHLGMTDAFIWDKGTPNEHLTTPEETQKILADIHSEIISSQLIYRHKWRVGDFIISDNLAVGHEATEETQHDPELRYRKLI
ncbi:uncharacterized protein TRIADDRAFT_58876 [Trichoplax adhaerens]|uniref:TauD/TfdA-like domain-containing protein n=1 Tax=Trichoplax adhaerens TaxID=10228 RepID=B3S3X1_TRIAD|nr:hypothetical protein TRIADDRAFT_58876 [Trichoplax adhaerens]EDV22354.1 hypothetical protein TRIADDRAFT_58876 [Trichoplax adhaerens]|eukprot:XP_002114898.1 hypothetical protein TRIADDRAFT_58876 [Trichoplax adhaerens]